MRNLGQLADEMGLSLPSLALTWTLTNPHVSTTILGATKESQLTENLKALEVLPTLTTEKLAKIDEIMGTKPVSPDH